MNHFDIYQKAVKTLRSNPSSEVDKFIVDQWTALKNLTNEINSLRKDNADMYLKNDLLESQLAKALGTPVVWKM